MNREPRRFQKKTPEELSKQVEVADALSRQDGTELIPQGKDVEDIVGIPLEDLKARYPEKFASYLELLRKEPRLAYAWIKGLTNLDAFIRNQEVRDAAGEITNPKEQYQIAVQKDLRDFLESGKTEGYVRLPTGTGKTVIFVKLIEALGLKSIIVVPRTALLEQTDEEFGEFAPNVERGLYYGKRKELGKQTTITTYQSLVPAVERGDIEPSDYDLVILDEAHRSLTEGRKDAVGKFQSSVKIGFTATPEFSDDKKVTNLLREEIHGLELSEAIEKGLITRPTWMPIETGTDLSSVRLNAKGEYDQDDLEKAVDVESRNRLAVALYKGAFDGKRGVVYCVGVEHAKRMVELYGEVGVKAEVVYGNMDDNLLDDTMLRYKKGEIDLLCNADLLIEGFDAPEASVCLNLRPTRSRVMAEQRAGRVLRLDPNDPKKRPAIIDFVDRNDDPEKRPVMFHEVMIGDLPDVGPSESSKKKEGTDASAYDDMRKKILGLKINGLVYIPGLEEALAGARESDQLRSGRVPSDWMLEDAFEREFEKRFGGGSEARAALASVTNNPKWRRTFRAKDAVGRSAGIGYVTAAYFVSEDFNKHQQEMGGVNASMETERVLGHIIDIIETERDAAAKSKRDPVIDPGLRKELRDIIKLALGLGLELNARVRNEDLARLMTDGADFSELGVTPMLIEDPSPLPAGMTAIRFRVQSGGAIPILERKPYDGRMKVKGVVPSAAIRVKKSVAEADKAA